MSLLKKQDAFLEHREIIAAIKNCWLTSKPTASEDAVSLRLRFNTWLNSAFDSKKDKQTIDRLKMRFHAALDEALNSVVDPRALVLYVPMLPARHSPIGTTISLMPSPADWWRSLAVTTLVFFTTAWLISNLGSTAPYDRQVFHLSKFTRVATDGKNAFQRGSDGKSIRLTSRAVRPATSGRPGGVSLKLPTEIEQAVSGKLIEVTVEVEPLATNAAGQFAVAYSTAAVGDSGWQKFDLREGQTVFSFRYKVPEHPEGKLPSKDFIGIWADTSGQGAGVLIKDVSIGVIGRS
ncbi:MAG: hypothetical protein AAFR27_05030 [Pseudomonadota bacterium]